MSDEPIPDVVARVLALDERATPGPWYEHFSMHGDPHVVSSRAWWLFTEIATPTTSPMDYGRANAEWIASARSDAVTLAREVERLLSLLAKAAVEIHRLRTEVAMLRDTALAPTTEEAT